MYTYRTLENMDMETLHQTFLKAFSDYQVKIDMPLWRFQQMLVRRGYSAECSMGAFDGDDLVGFILNGLRNWSNKATAYDEGTGVIPEYRRKGITSSMFRNAAGILKEKGVEQYLLEVILSNTKAYELYKKQGFEITRTFSCYQADQSTYKPIKSYCAEHVDKIAGYDLRRWISFWDIEPSWQNSMDSVNAVPDAFVCSIVHFDNEIAGYGIIDKKTGDIPQIAVRKDCRGKGIGTRIVNDLINSTASERISVINVDSKYKAMNEFLKKLGFRLTVEQYEMIFKLGR